MSRKPVIEIISEHKTLLLFISLVLAILLVALQFLSNVASEHKAEKDQRNLIKANKELQAQVNTLTGQNIKLLKQASVLEGKTDLLNKIGKTQLFATFYTEELSQPIREMWFKISFKKEVEYLRLLTQHFAFEISFDRDNSKTERFFVTDGGLKRHKKGKEINLSSFRITSDSMRKESDQVHSQMFAPGQQTLKDIVVPVSLSDSDQMTIKNFQGMAVIVFLPEQIIDLADKVEFIVNEWAILDQPIKSAVWVPSKLNWAGIGEIVDLKRSAANDPKDAPAYSLWQIDLFNKIPKKYPGMSEGHKPLINVINPKSKS